ncbi:hypothetical protein [Virgibacillus salexigens]|uniref:Uncharacterized protein n=1 Tax=Virgibacillus massiliensis TaxID=1462526 RepID=A0A024QH67_9BACI|nr:hypothetical protein [Virgibacillus massiliensis]CDQ41849.1 hypothetical protein BN990_04228 [Virgibacillus massiliensis]
MDVTYKQLILEGKYLGYCGHMGYLYSIFVRYDEKEQEVYQIYGVHGNALHFLIEYPILRKEHDVDEL